MYRAYPFTVNFLTLPSSYDVSHDTFDTTTNGMICSSDVDIQVIVSCVAYYSDGETEVSSKTITIVGNNTDTSITTDLLDDAFLYSPTHSGLANYVEFIIYPISCCPLKWSFKFS